jgi:hypothetical protein
MNSPDPCDLGLSSPPDSKYTFGKYIERLLPFEYLA